MDLLRVKPDGLESDLEVNSNRVTLKPLLLNVQDALEIQVLTEGLPSTVQVLVRPGRDCRRLPGGFGENPLLSEDPLHKDQVSSA